MLNEVFEDDDLYKMKGGSSNGSLGKKASDENIFRGMESPSQTAIRMEDIDSSLKLHNTLKNKFSLTQLAKTRMSIKNATSKKGFNPASPTKVNISDLKNLQANLDCQLT